MKTQFCDLGMHDRCTDVMKVCTCNCHKKQKNQKKAGK